MSETARFALIITLTGAIALAAVLVNRLSARLRAAGAGLDAGRGCDRCLADARNTGAAATRRSSRSSRWRLS